MKIDWEGVKIDWEACGILAFLMVLALAMLIMSIGLAHSAGVW